MNTRDRIYDWHYAIAHDEAGSPLVREDVLKKKRPPPQSAGLFDGGE